MAKYNPEASLRDQNIVAGYKRAEVMVEVLNNCGDNLTRANVMKQAASRNLSQLGRRGVKFVRTASCELFLRGVVG